MFSVELARKNVELHNYKAAKMKAQQARAFIEKVVEPAIIESSMSGKNRVVVHIGGCLNAETEVVDMIHEAGFQTERGRSDTLLCIIWYAGGTPTYRNTRTVAVLG